MVALIAAQLMGCASKAKRFTAASRPAGKSASTKASKEVASLRVQLETAKAECLRLRVENEKLRAEVVRRIAQVIENQKEVGPRATPTHTVSNVAAPPPPPPVTTTAVPQTYWITLSSGKRHNQTCNFYRTTVGRECGPNEGKPCKYCGG